MNQYILTLEQVGALFDYVGAKLDESDCDHSRRYTQQWLDQNIPQADHEKILAEIEDMGGYCDCEVLMNCYEEYADELYPEDED